MRLIGSTEPVCPACSHMFAKMPQRKGRCPSCGAEYLSRTCPIRTQKILVAPEDASSLEALWEYHHMANELARDLSPGSLVAGPAGAPLIDAAADALSPNIMPPRSLREWSPARAAWIQLAGVCAVALRLELAVHALAGCIALDISGVRSNFGAFVDVHGTERELAELEGTTPPPFPRDVSKYRQENRWFVPIAPLPDVGEVNPWSLQKLEALCGFGHVTMEFVRWSIEAHCEAMTRRGALMVPADQAWARFVALA